YNIAQVHIERGDEEEAIRHLRQAIEHKVNDPEAYYQLGGLYYKLGKAREARLSFERFLQLAPDHPQADRVRQLLQ
ncbi:MAG: tetratricopeptide repeat protein, partial [Gemmatimonadetes bacterium]|nr:tetratricopeptide repeat protein [Gemmatimonadota bacterium]